MGFSPDVLIRWGANWGPATMSGDYWRLITAGFVHGSIIHIAFNMWCLWSLCQLAERLFGSLITMGIYLLTGVAGALLSIAWNHGRLEVGASGAIFGIAGAILSGIKFGNVSVGPMQRRQIFSSLIFFIIFNLTIGLGPGIDNMCHLGGLVSGLIFGVPLATAQASGKKSFEWATLVLAGFVLAALGHHLPLGALGLLVHIHERRFSGLDHGRGRPRASRRDLPEGRGSRCTMAADDGHGNVRPDGAGLERDTVPEEIGLDVRATGC